MLFLRTANFFAKYAQPRWNKLRLLRPLCRWAYRFIVETPAELSRLRGVRRTNWEIADHNSYPYRDHRFAPWEEDDTPSKYCLVSDSRGAVIRRSVSYLLHKYHEATGQHLLLFDGGKHVNDAKNWEKVMELNMKPVVKGNFAEFLQDPTHRSGYYIGVSPKEGDYGQLYWYEGVEKETGRIYASTYFNFEYIFIELLPCELGLDYITWYRAC